MAENELQESTYRVIRRRIRNGQLAPGGHVSELALAREMGVSRMPVRAALRKLVATGLVEQVPRVGTRVTDLDQRQLEELYDMRLALESFCARRAAERVTADQLSQLADLCEQMWSFARLCRQSENGSLDRDTAQRFVEVDIEFHLLIVGVTGNQRIIQNLDDVRILSGLAQASWQPFDLRIIAWAWLYHQRILRGLKRGDPQATQQAMMDHIRVAKSLVLSNFAVGNPVESEKQEKTHGQEGKNTHISLAGEDS